MNNNESIKDQHWMLFVLMLKNIANQKNITIFQISEKTGLNISNLKRIFNLQYYPSLPVYLSIAKALEVNIFFEDRESKTDLNKVFETAMEQLGRRPNKLSKN